MHLSFLWVSPLKEPGLHAYTSQLLKRIRQWIPVDVQEIKAGPYHPQSSLQQDLEKDARRLQKHLKRFNTWLLLDADGQPWSTADWHRWWLENLQYGRPLAIVCGGPYGVHPQIQSLATWRVSLGPIVMSHQLVRAVVVEQIYRVITLWKGVPYAK